MARPVEFQEIISGKLDDNERFPRAIDLTRREFQALFDKKMILGAFLFGSATFGDETIRSDLDVLLATDEPSAETTEALHAISRYIYQETAVPLELSHFTMPQLQTGNHPYIPPLARWLNKEAQKQPENVIGFNPVNYIHHPGEYDLRAIVHKDLATKFYGVQKEYLQGVHFHPNDSLAYILNLPHIVGRRVIDVLEYEYIIPEGTLKDLKKVSIAQAVEKIFAAKDPDLWDLYQDISRDFQAYNQLIQDASRGCVTTDEYEHMIQATLEADLPKVMELLRHFNRQFLVMCDENDKQKLEHYTSLGQSLQINQFGSCQSM